MSAVNLGTKEKQKELQTSTVADDANVRVADATCMLDTFTLMTGLRDIQR